MQLMPKFIPYNYQQDTMVVINFDDQILPGTFEHALHYLIEHKVDLSAFHAVYQNTYEGRPAIDPAILLKIILFAYSKGITSSRHIQWCCQSNIIFKALSCDTSPDFTTIAAFVSGHSAAISNLFEQVVLICHEQGLIGHDLIAIDGCKLPSNAAKEWSGTLEELAHKRDKLKDQIARKLEEHKANDKLPSCDETQVRGHKLENTLDTLTAAHDKVAEFLKTAEPRQGKGARPKEVKSNITDNESCKMKTSKGTVQGYNGIASVDEKHQIIVDAEAIGEGQEHHAFIPVLERIQARYQQLGISESIYADGLVVTADTGYSNKANLSYLHAKSIDGYVPDHQFRQRDPAFADQKANHKAKQGRPSNGPRLFSPQDFHVDIEKKHCECPAGKALTLIGNDTDRNGNHKLFFQAKLSHCRSCVLKSSCMRRPEAADSRTGHGRQVSFIVTPNAGKSEPVEWMKKRVDSVQGKQVYAERLAVVEPVFGNIRSNKGLDRFSLRGKEKVNGQWQLFSLVHNIEKINHYGDVPKTAS
jgi:transposase